MVSDGDGSMLVETASANRARLNNALVMSAILGVFAAFYVIGHKDLPHYWVKLLVPLAFSTGCLLFTRSKDALDTFLTAVAALFTLCAVAMTAGDRANHNWWPFFIGFTVAAAVLVLLTRKRREALLGIAVILAVRLVVALFAFVFRH
jgi:hypothetical protein